MFKIGDFSRLGQVSVRMLRHYDKLGLLKPGQTDAWTGYRYYTIDQLPRLHRIVALNDLGLTLQQIGDLMAEDEKLSADRLRGMLAMRRAAIEQELAHTQMQLAGVEARLQQIEQEGKPSPYEIAVKSVSPLPVASIRALVPHVSEMGHYCEVLYRQLVAELNRAGIAPLKPEVTLYHNDEYTEVDLEVEAAVVVAAGLLSRRPAALPDHVLLRELPDAALVASVVFEGSYQEIPGAVLALLGWIGANHHGIAAPLRELHLSGPAHTDGVHQEPAVIELQVPIQPLPLTASPH